MLKLSPFTRPARGPQLTETAYALLKTLTRLRFATREQLLYWSSVSHLSTIARLTDQLVKRGLLTCALDSAPRVYRVTSAACRLIGVADNRRQTPVSVMQYYCYRNAAEIALRDSHPGATIQSRGYCLQFGLHPARGESLVTINKQFGLLLMDHNLMSSERIERSWLRLHKPDVREYQLPDGQLLRRWCDVVQHYFVFSTDDAAVARHRSFIDQCETPISAKVEYLRPIWGWLTQ